MGTTSGAGSETQVKLQTWLREKDMRLWLPPYTHSVGQVSGDFSKEIIEEAAGVLDSTYDEAAAQLEVVRKNAIEKLAARHGRGQLNCVRLQNPFGSPLQVLVNLGDDVRSLKRSVAHIIARSGEDFQIVSGGEILRGSRSLTSCGVAEGSSLMILATVQRDGAEIQLSEWLSVAEELATNGDIGDKDMQYYVNIRNQAGGRLELTEAEETGLAMAMALHEKGAAELHGGHKDSALLLLLEADRQFSRVETDLLRDSDNTALLHLDICWCYLVSQNLDLLPDAARRLTLCRAQLERAYGAGLQRLRQLQPDEEGRGLFHLMRLSLLEAVVAHHSGVRGHAFAKIREARRLAEQLGVVDERIAEVVSLGFSSREARTALRATLNDSSRAVELIVRKREKESEITEENQGERHQFEATEHFPYTLDGRRVKGAALQQLLDLGYSAGGAGEALRLSNNDVSAALDLLTANLEEYSHLPDPRDFCEIPLQADISALVALGFTEEVSTRTLQHYIHVDVASQILLTYSGQLPPLLETRIQQAGNRGNRRSGSATPSSGRSTPTRSSESSVESDSRLTDTNIAHGGGLERRATPSNGRSTPTRSSESSVESDFHLTDTNIAHGGCLERRPSPPSRRRSPRERVMAALVKDLKRDPDSVLDSDMTAEWQLIEQYSLLIE